MKRKHPRDYRAMRRRLIDALPEVAEAMNHVRAGALGATSGRQFHTVTDADNLCALVIEAVAWWAAEERSQVQAIRDAARELVELHGRIDAAVSGLCELVARSEELCSRHGLRVNLPMWRGNLDEAFNEVRERFPGWGRDPQVKAYAEFETRRFYLYRERPNVLDLVKAARSLGALDTVGSARKVRGRTGEWDRLGPTWVSADDPLAEQALANKAGSGPASERAQLRQLMAELREVGRVNGWFGSTPGPLEFLSDRDLSLLCSVAVGPPDDPDRDPFTVDSIRKARDSFNARRSAPDKPPRMKP